MLVRTVRRKLPRDAGRHLQPTFDQLHLPWLCPALYLLPQHQQSIRRTTTIIDQTSRHALTASSQPRQVTRVQKNSSSRSLAYVPSLDSSDLFDDYLPWESSEHLSQGATSPSLWSQPRVLSQLSSYDPTLPLIIADSTRPGPRKFSSRHGIGGDIGGIHQLLQACLQVGQLDRATATVRRLNVLYKPDSPQLIQAHNVYIRALVAQIVITKDQSLLSHLDGWYNADMRERQIKPDEITLALLIQACLHDSNEDRIGTSIRKYIKIAKEFELYDEVRAATIDILSEKEFDRVKLVCSCQIYLLFNNY